MIKNLEVLTGIRAIAALMVYFHHYNPITQIQNKYLFFLFKEMHIGVTFFFVLSGFLMSYNYHQTNFNIKWFYIKRIARIFPIYFILTTFSFIVFYLNGRYALNFDFFLSYFLNVTFLKGFFEIYLFSGIPQGWSLTVEFTFYIIFPLFLILLNSKRRLFFLTISSLLLGFLIAYIFSSISFYGFINSFKFMLNYTFFGRIFEFLVGMYFGIIFKNSNNKMLDSRINKIYFSNLGLFIIIISYTLMVYLSPVDAHSVYLYKGIFINNIILPIGIGFLYMNLIYKLNIFSKLLATKFMDLLGKSSFVFYLIHKGVIYNFITFYIDNYMIILISLWLISIALYKLVEENLNKYIRKCLK